MAAMISSRETAPSTTGRVLHWAAGYDLLVWLVTHRRDRAFREQLIGWARLSAGESVLDIGCGTGSLAIVAKRQVGESGKVCGVDASPAMVARARSKAATSGVDVSFEVAVVESLPFPDARFDVVLSTLMLHHLPRQLRQQCLREVRRVLKPQGRLLIVDFGRPQRKSGLIAHFHRHGHVNLEDVVSQLDEAGLRRVESGPVGVSSLEFVLATRV
jgi:ubiquinone/menaquinone biosynthesis C-methylase UbiE